MNRETKRGGLDVSRQPTVTRERRLAAAVTEVLESRRLLSTTVYVSSTLDNVADATVTGPTVTLREAVNYANQVGGNVTIAFNPSLFSTPQTITLKPGALVVNDPNGFVTIDARSTNGVTLDGNAAQGGTFPAFALTNGSLELDGVTVTDAYAQGGGGGVNAAAGTSLTLRSDTFTGDAAAGGQGNAIVVRPTASLTIVNSTFANGSPTISGGGDVLIQGGGASHSISDSTFAATGYAALLLQNSAPVVLTNDVVTAATTAIASSDGSPLAITGSHNVVPDGSDGLADTIHADPKLGPLADNGGPTQTLALLAGSPALGAGVGLAGIATDQRGGTRATTGTVDAGAWQTQPTPASTFLSPVSGPTLGGYAATAGGLPFLATHGISVTVAGVAATVLSTTPTTVSFTVPSMLALINAGVTSLANIPVAVRSAGGTSVTVASKFNYDAPQIVSASSAVIPTAGGATVTLAGLNFVLAGGGTVVVGGQAIDPSQIQSWTNTQIVFTAPALASLSLASASGGVGSVSVQVDNPDGTASNAQSLLYQLPASGAPAVGLPASGLASYFGYGATFTAVVGGATNPTGNVQFYADGAAIGAPVPLVNATASLTWHLLSVGTYAITFTYGGDATYARATSAPSTVTVAYNAAVPTAPGTYSATGRDDATAVFASPGYYVSTAGSNGQVPATAGTFAPGYGNAISTPADPGYYVPSPGAATETPASPGYFVSSYAAVRQTPADRGQYVPTSAAAAPTNASPGYYVPTVGSSTQTPASPGYYVPTAGLATQTPADPGYYVPTAAATAEIADPAGTTSGVAAVLPTPIVTVNPIGIAAGVPLTDGLLSGTYPANIPGTFSFGSLAGTVPTAGATPTVYAEPVTFTPTDTAHYAVAASTVQVTVSARVAPTLTITANDATYTGAPYAAAVSVTDANGVALSGATVQYFLQSDTARANPVTPVDVGGYTAVVTYPGNAAYAPAAGSANFSITQATPTVSVGDNGGTYNGQPFPASATVTGVNGTPLDATGVSYTYYTYTPGSGGGGAKGSAGNSSPADPKGAPGGQGGLSNPTSQPPVDAGNYAVVANYPGSLDYTGGTAGPTYFTITQATPTVTITAPNTPYSGSAYAATASVTDLNGAPLTTGAAVQYFLQSDTAQANPVAPVDAGNYTVVVTYPGNTDYAYTVRSANFSITKATPVISITAINKVYDGTAAIVSFSIGGVNGAPVPGTTSFGVYLQSDTAQAHPVNPIDAGTYTVVASYAGSTDYAATTKSVPLVISAATPTIAVNAPNAPYTGSAYAATASVTGLGGTPLTGAALQYFLQSDTAHATPVSPINAGAYTAVVTYPGSTNYASAQKSANFSITPVAPGIALTAANLVYNGAAYAGASAPVTGVGGASLGAATLSYYAASDTAHSHPLADPSTVGSYAVVAAYAGGGNYTAATTSATFAITQATGVVTVPAVMVAYGGTASLSATLSTATGALLSGRSLTFTLNGKAIGTAVTNANGVATTTASVAGINPGVLSAGIQVAFAGDANVTGKTTTAALTITDAAIVATGTTLAIPILPIALTLGTFTQARAGAAAADFVVTVDFGDGTAAQKATVIADPLHAGQFDIVGPLHLYASIFKTYTVTVTISTVAKFGAAAGATATFSTKIVA